jgi:hypothetical protein
MSTNNTVALIQLYGKMQPPNVEPLSVEVLAGALTEELPGIDAKIFTFSYLDADAELDLLFNELSICQPFMVGISIPQSTFELSLKLLDRISRLSPSPLIVVGHALPTYAPEVFIRIYHQLFIVRGWGDESIVSLARKKLEGADNFAEIPNLVFFREGDIIYTSAQFQTKFYRPVRVSLEDYYVRVESSRGCSYNVCTFCTRPLGMQNSIPSWTRRDVDDVISELRFLKSKSVKRFTFTDEDFIGNDMDTALKLAYQLQEVAGLKFSLSVRADSVYDSQKSFAENQESKKLFEILRDAGLELVFIGAESLSSSQLRRYGKGIDPEYNLVALSILQSLGINYEIGFISFDPLMSISEVGENILVLEKSGIWSRIGNLFSVLRPQISSSYVKLLAMSNLLGEFNLDSMSYSFKFIDPKVQLLAEFCLTWEKEIDLIHIICKNLERMAGSDVIYTRAMFDFRSLFFRLLKIAYNQILEDSFIPSRTKFIEYYREQEGIISAIAYHIDSIKNRTRAEQELFLHCQNYLSMIDRTS